MRDGSRGRDARTTLDLAAFEGALRSDTGSARDGWRPWLVRLSRGEIDRFRAVCADAGIPVTDTVHRQLQELAAVRLPAGDPSERRLRVEEELASTGEDAYGRWLYLPWLGRVYRVLDEDAYFEVVTDRNRDKITREEQRLLRTKRVGVVGLSVGGEAAVTLAQEHLCGEIRLADFDALDLSNLNRLGSGVDELGVNKAVILARRIARLDPYLGIEVFPEGVSEETVDAFLDGLDLLVEECDGLPMKWEIRRRARERGLNVVFAADERGFLSVEPYGDRPGLAPFHGRLDAAQPPREAFDDPLDFMRELAVWLGGWEHISERSRRSVEEIGRTLCGYPQLASEARYAAGQVGHVARRLLLGEKIPPFAGHLEPGIPVDPGTGDRGRA